MTGTYFAVDGVTWQSSGYDDSGTRWVMTDLSGWFEPPTARESYVARVGNGSFDAPVYDDNRVITWTGYADAPDTATREAAKLTLARVARVLRDGADVTGYDDDGIPKTVHARRSASWKVTDVGLTSVQYQMSVTCPDPYKYGPAETALTGLPAPGSGGLVFPLFNTGGLDFGPSGVTGQVTLVNVGTEDAWPTFTISGPILGGIVLTDMSTGRMIVYSGDVLATGTLLIVDSSSGRASLNGSDRTGELTVKQWTAVPAGGASSWQFSTLGASGQTGTCLAALNPTYQ